jgi:hypothetical protein
MSQLPFYLGRFYSSDSLLIGEPRPHYPLRFDTKEGEWLGYLRWEADFIYLEAHHITMSNHPNSKWTTLLGGTEFYLKSDTIGVFDEINKQNSRSGVSQSMVPFHLISIGSHGAGIADTGIVFNHLPSNIFTYQVEGKGRKGMPLYGLRLALKNHTPA